MTNSFIQADHISIGKNVVIHPSAIIRGVKGRASNITIGDNVYIGEQVQIICDDFSIGDYSKIQHHTNIHGYLPCKIGHNAWVGQYSIIDSIGGATIGDNCGIGAHSQLWSHIKYGDTLEGCRFLTEKPLTVGNDVWFVGHCIVSPIIAHDKSMAMVGSVITKDMEMNHIYAGSPAKDLTEKIGYQFKEVQPEEKLKKMTSYLNSFQSNSSIRIVMQREEVDFQDLFSYFVINDRKYKKTGSEEEVAFMNFLLPEKAKFTPYGHDTL